MVTMRVVLIPAKSPPLLYWFAILRASTALVEKKMRVNIICEKVDWGEPTSTWERGERADRQTRALKMSMRQLFPHFGD